MNRRKLTLPESAPSHLSGRTVLAGAIGLSLASGAALAQDAGNQRVEHMVVEGQQTNPRGVSGKLTGSILDTPKTITILDSGLIEERGATSLVETLKSVPGITFNAGEGGQPQGDNLKIRGFDAGADVFVDGVRDAGSQSRDIFALEQVEVIMGPGSAYSGRGSAGGSVNLATKRPMLEDSLSMRLGMGNESYQRVAVDGNYQIGNGAAARLNLLYHEGDVPGRDSVFYEHTGIAPSIAFGLDGDTRMSLDYYHYRTDDMPDYSIPYDYDTGEPADVDRENFYGLLDRDFQETGADIATMEIGHRFSDDLSITNTTRYGKTSNEYVVTNPDDSAGNVINGYVWRGTKNRNAETETVANITNLRGSFETGGLEHSFVTGLELSQEEMSRAGFSVSSTLSGGDRILCSDPGSTGAIYNYECTSLANPNPSDPWVGTITPTAVSTVQETDTVSVYAFDTVTFNEHWQVNGGLRFDDYETKTDSLSSKDEFWNYQLGVVYKPNEAGSIYVSTGTSSRPSGNAPDGTDSLSSATADLEPERNKTWELGTKWLLLDSSVALQASIFRNTKENARVSSDPSCSGRGCPVDTIGENQVDGFEIGINGQLTEQWSLMASYTYLDSEITDNGPVDSTLDGTPFPNTPENSYNLWTTYAFTPTLSVGVGANYVDERFGSTNPDGRFGILSIPDYTTYDMMASWQISEQMGLQLNVQNLTDETYYTRPYAAHYAAIGPGRSMILTFSYDM